MSKRFTELPDRGDRVKLRGRVNVGILKKYDPESLWATVVWKDSGPKICHLRELEKI